MKKHFFFIIVFICGFSCSVKAEDYTALAKQLVKDDVFTVPDNMLTQAYLEREHMTVDVLMAYIGVCIKRSMTDDEIVQLKNYCSQKDSLAFLQKSTKLVGEINK